MSIQKLDKILHNICNLMVIKGDNRFWTKKIDHYHGYLGLRIQELVWLDWGLQLEEYDYNIIYKPGVQNTNSEAVNRIGVTNLFQEFEISNEYQHFNRKKIEIYYNK